MGLPFRQTAMKWANQLYDRATTVLQYVDHGQGAKYYLEGQSYQKNRLHESAIKAFSQALKFDDRYLSAYLLRGISYFRLSQWEAARKDFSKAIALDEDEEVAYFHRGLVMRKLDQPELAIADFSEAVEINPGYTAAYANRAPAYFQIGKYEEALRDFELALEGWPTEAALYFGKARICILRGHKENALTALTQTIRFDHMHTPALQLRGQMLREAGRLVEAERDWERWVIQEEHNPIALGFLALIRLQMGESDMAGPLMQRALENGFRPWRSPHNQDPGWRAALEDKVVSRLIAAYRLGDEDEEENQG